MKNYMTLTKSIAPWNNDEIESINNFQTQGLGHPFTCYAGHTLVATKESMMCKECDYSQNWCHEFMINNMWKEIFKLPFNWIEQE